jgi:predicted membrane metal-binding protein
VPTLEGMTDLFQLFAVSAVVMGLAQTITKERIFLPLREKLGGKDTWCGYLASCPYCASHYLAFVLVPLTGTYPIRVVVGGWVGSVLSWFLSSILVTVIAAFYRVLFWFVDEAQGLVRRRQRTEEEEIATKRLVRRKVAQELPPEQRDEPPAADSH